MKYSKSTKCFKSMFFENASRSTLSKPEYLECKTINSTNAMIWSTMRYAIDHLRVNLHSSQLSEPFTKAACFDYLFRESVKWKCPFPAGSAYFGVWLKNWFVTYILPFLLVQPYCTPSPSPVAPSVRPTSQLLGAPLGSDVQLECTVEASPMPVSYWLKGGRVLPNSFAGAANGNYEQPGLSRPEMLLDG